MRLLFTVHFVFLIPKLFLLTAVSYLLFLPRDNLWEFTTTSFRDTFWIILQCFPFVPCTRRTSVFPISESHDSTSVPLPRASVVAFPTRNECKANSSGFRRDFAAIDCSKSTTVPRHSYSPETAIRAKGGVIGEPREACYQLQCTDNGTAVPLERRPELTNLVVADRA